MKVAVTGSHGLIAGHLIPALEARGHRVVPVLRGPAGAGHDPTGSRGAGAIRWDPDAGTIDRPGLAGVDAVVHLAGLGIFARRWNAAHKRALLDSRVKGTSLLARTLASLDTGPRVLVSGSAIGFYGDRDDELLTEHSPSGSGFLADLCRQWEQATAPASEAGIRTVLARTGLVQAADGGALRTQLPVFRLGLGAQFGRGRSWASWISIDDEVGGLIHALDNDAVSGPLNLVAPNPVTNADYTAILARVLRRPAIMVAPPLAVKAVLGAEMASELLLASQRVQPSTLLETGYEWRQPQLEGALRALLRR